MRLRAAARGAAPPRAPRPARPRRGASRSCSVRTPPATAAEARALLCALTADLSAEVDALGAPSAVVAFSGGVDSSLAAWLCREALGAGGVRLVTAVSPALAAEQLRGARRVAEALGLAVEEVATSEGARRAYVANEGAACYECKSELYGTLEAVGRAGRAASGGEGGAGGAFVLVNGTNADDLSDPTRLGLLAAAEHAVLSPIATLPKLAVRLCAREAGLRNWDLAASPCLRSRLALGVRATSSALRAVGEAEAHARRALDLAHTSDLRVRLLSDPDPAAGEPGVAVLEVPADVEPKARAALVELRECIPSNLDLVAVRAFQSGAVATAEGTAKAALLAAGLTEATDDMTKH